MMYLRNIILKQSCGVIQSFTKSVLDSFWNYFQVYCWNNNYCFSKFSGKELSLFVANADVIIAFMKENLIQTEYLESYEKALKVLPEIFEFISMTYIEGNDLEYKNKIEKFECNVCELYMHAKNTILQDDEPFYFHCLRFYLPSLAKQTYEEHHLGLGIFNMQGFERRNKESKKCLSNYCTNNKKNQKAILGNNMKRLLRSYWNNN